MARTQKERSHETRTRLMEAGRKLFGANGFTAVTNDMIADEAGLTRGALHYQFNDKEGLFEAVCTQVVAELLETLNERTMEEATSEADELALGARIMLEICAAPDISKILLVEGPSVLGLARWRALIQPAAIELIVHALEHWVEDGLWPKDKPLEPMAALIQGAIIQAGLAVAEAEDPIAARSVYGQAVTDMIESLKVR